MSLKLTNKKDRLIVSIGNQSVEELEQVSDRLIAYIAKIKKELLAERTLIESAKSLTDSENIRVVIQRKNFKRPPLYQWKEGGEYKTWSGVGKMPTFLAEQTKKGKTKTLDDFKINKSNNIKYQYQASNGQIRNWSGVGKMPLELEALTKRGFKLENFKV